MRINLIICSFHCVTSLRSFFDRWLSWTREENQTRNCGIDSFYFSAHCIRCLSRYVIGRYGDLTHQMILFPASSFFNGQQTVLPPPSPTSECTFNRIWLTRLLISFFFFSTHFPWSRWFDCGSLLVFIVPRYSPRAAGSPLLSVCCEPGEKEQNRKKYSNSRVERGRVAIRHPHPITEGRKEGKINEKRKKHWKWDSDRR